MRLAAAALERLDREVNGGALPLPAEEVEMRPLLEAAVAALALAGEPRRRDR